MMLAALLLAGTCSAMPLFAMDGPACAASGTECRCSECMIWDPTPSAVWYDIVRQTAGTGPWVIVGSVNVEGGYTDDDGVAVVQNPQELWCYAKDNPMPHEGVSHRYEVRACNYAGCGPWSAQTITYIAAPYACYEGGHEAPCYAGDPVAAP